MEVNVEKMGIESKEEESQSNGGDYQDYES